MSRSLAMHQIYVELTLAWPIIFITLRESAVSELLLLRKMRKGSRM